MLNFSGLFKRFFSVQTLRTIADTESVLANFDPESEAIVTQEITPGRAGQVEYRGSFWTARCHQAVTLKPGDLVYVVDIRHVLTLYVQPAPASARIEDLQDTPAKDAVGNLVVCHAEMLDQEMTN
jgi:membrane-bound ClpP family serine protease